MDWIVVLAKLTVIAGFNLNITATCKEIEIHKVKNVSECKAVEAVKRELNKEYFITIQ